jgi:membrane protease YdiL (CAAX protease family)
MSFLRRLLSILWAGLLALVIVLIGQAAWVALLSTNLRITPKIPWAVAAMAGVLWVMWQYLGGRWWPRRTAEARRRNLRAFSVSRQTFAWALVGGVFLIAALSGLWIVLFQISRTPANTIPGMAGYPLTTLVPILLMSCLAAPFAEEAAFRGYAQSILERNFRGIGVVLISSAMFAAAHLTYGFYWTKLTVYFLFGVAAAVTVRLANSILPGIAVHALADLTFFTLVWPHDAARRLITEGGADTWFWVHVAQIGVGTVLAIFCFRKLGQAGKAGLSPSLRVSGSLTASG